MRAVSNDQVKRYHNAGKPAEGMQLHNVAFTFGRRTIVIKPITTLA